MNPNDHVTVTFLYCDLFISVPSWTSWFQGDALANFLSKLFQIKSNFMNRLSAHIEPNDGCFRKDLKIMFISNFQQLISKFFSVTYVPIVNAPCNGLSQCSNISCGLE